MTKVFISWSGKASESIALHLKAWLPDVIQAIDPWVSSEDIYKGTKWLPEVLEKLESYSVGILCITPENYQKPWILFEAGALAKSVKGSVVIPMLFGLSKSDVTPPLSLFQMTSFEKADCLKMFKDINESLVEGKIELDRLERSFENNWASFNSRVEASLKETPGHKAEKSITRSNDQIMDEVLALTRANDRALAEIRGSLEHRLSAVEAMMLMRPPMTLEQLQNLGLLPTGNVIVTPSAATARADTSFLGGAGARPASGSAGKGLLNYDPGRDSPPEQKKSK